MHEAVLDLLCRVCAGNIEDYSQCRVGRRRNVGCDWVLLPVVVDGRDAGVSCGSFLVRGADDYEVGSSLDADLILVIVGESCSLHDDISKRSRGDGDDGQSASRAEDNFDVIFRQGSDGRLTVFGFAAAVLLPGVAGCR